MMVMAEKPRESRSPHDRSSNSSHHSLGKPSTSESLASADKEGTLADFLGADSAPAHLDDGDNVQSASESREEDQQEKEEYPSRWRLTLITVGLSLCVFCTALVRLLGCR